MRRRPVGGDPGGASARANARYSPANGNRTTAAVPRSAVECRQPVGFDHRSVYRPDGGGLTFGNGNAFHRRRLLGRARLICQPYR